MYSGLRALGYSGPRSNAMALPPTNMETQQGISKNSVLLRTNFSEIPHKLAKG